MREIAREIGQQYSLGYYPSDAKSPDLPRSILGTALAPARAITLFGATFRCTTRPRLDFTMVATFGNFACLDGEGSK